jgi:hypothetical protein
LIKGRQINNKQMKQTIFGILVVALLFLIWVVPKTGTDINLGGGTNYHNQSSSTVKTVGTTSTPVRITTGSEQWICGGFGNTTAIGFGEAAATSSVGGSGLVFASSTPTCYGPFHFQGTIYGASNTGTTDVGIIDFN